MKELTTRQRMSLVFEHRQPDRLPIFDTPWAGTLSRWHREGMPEGVDYTDYFGLDKIGAYMPDNSPRYPAKILEQNGVYKIYTTVWGATQKELIGEDTTPEFLNYKVNTREAWEEAKKRMTPDPSRIDWAYLKKNYPIWQQTGAWKLAQLWFGFDVTHSWMAGTDTVLIAMLEDPDWCVDMFNHFLDVQLALYEKIFNEGYTFDCVWWWDDMGYSHRQFFSLDTYRELLKPVHRRAIDWAHSKGMKAEMHSCGDINPFVPELVGMGLDALNPLEVKAGMDPLALKAQYGSRLVLHGGVNALLWNDLPALYRELDRCLPVLGRDGGYIFATDHSIPNTVSLGDFADVVKKVKALSTF